jgi:hypothetical protein
MTLDRAERSGISGCPVDVNAGGVMSPASN